MDTEVPEYSDRPSQNLQRAAKRYILACKEQEKAKTALDLHILNMRDRGFSLAQILRRIKKLNVTGYKSRQSIMLAADRAYFYMRDKVKRDDSGKTSV